MHSLTAALAFAEDDADEALAEAAWAVFSRNFLFTLTALNFFGWAAVVVEIEDWDDPSGTRDGLAGCPDGWV